MSSSPEVHPMQRTRSGTVCLSNANCVLLLHQKLYKICFIETVDSSQYSGQHTPAFICKSSLRIVSSKQACRYQGVVEHTFLSKMAQIIFGCFQMSCNVICSKGFAKKSLIMRNFVLQINMCYLLINTCGHQCRIEPQVDNGKVL